MRAMLDRILAQLREFFGRLSRRSRVTLLVLTLAVIALAIVAATLLSRTNYVLLYNAATQAEAGTIYNALTDMGVSARVEGGTRVLVPEDRVGELGAVLSAEGVIGPSGPDLDIMGMAASFNVTDSHARKLYEYQKAQDIRVLIMQTGRIQNCNVIVNIGQTSAFARPTNINKPTCVVMLEVRGGATLTNAEAQAIADIVRNAIPGIEYDSITVTDANLNAYRIGDDSNDFEMELGSRITLQNILSQQLQEQGLRVLTPIFGLSNIEVIARVVLNYDTESTERIEFEPPVLGETEGLARTASDLWEAARNGNIAGGIPGTDTNGMGSVEYPYGTLDDGEVYEKAVKERNYELNQTITTINREQGGVRSMNFGVFVNENAIPTDYSAEITDVISRGIGIPIDNISVQYVPFMDSVDDSMQQMYDDWAANEEQLKQQELVQLIIKWAVILALGIAFFSLIGMIARGARQQEPELVPVEGEYGGIDYIADDDYRDDEADEIEDIELNAKSSTLEQIERFIDKDPGVVAQLLRNWLTDE